MAQGVVGTALALAAGICGTVAGGLGSEYAALNVEVGASLSAGR